MTPIRSLPRGATVLAGLAAAVGLATLAAARLAGPAGLVLPLAVVGTLLLLQHPRLALATLLALVVVCEGNEATLVPALEAVYLPLAAGLAPVDLLFGVVLAAAALEVGRRGEPLRLPGLLTLPLALLVLAIGAGAVAGLANGASAGDVVNAARQLPYLILLPLVVVNVIRTRQEVLLALGLGVALAVLKAVLGLLTVATGRGRLVDGSTITFYEPVGNWLMLVALLGVLAALVLRVRDRLPVWVLVGAPFLLASLALSLRRSFWIALALGALLVLVLGVSPLGRRLLAPTAVLVAAGVWALGSVGFQLQGPVAERVASLDPGRIQANVEDRYRLDERANVLADIGARPVTGLGLAVGWSSAARGLPVEHENGRDYVHMVTLWYWLKLGVLGLTGYLALMAASCATAWRVWRRADDPLLRSAGLAGLCSLVALATIETTASFTGVESRFTVVLGAMLGLLVVLHRTSERAS